MKKINIAIDGPAGSGKGTTAKKIAEKLKYIYLDSGAIYRALTYYFLKNKIKYTDIEKIIKNFDKISIKFDLESGDIILNNENIEKEIRKKEVAENVSYYATKSTPLLRDFVTKISKKIIKKKGVVLEGRDATTVLDPNAELKIFLNADIEERAKRRFEQVKNDNENSFEDILKNLEKRDFLDKDNIEKSKKIAQEVNTTNTTIEEQVDIIKKKALKIMESE